MSTTATAAQTHVMRHYQETYVSMSLLMIFDTVIADKIVAYAVEWSVDMGEQHEPRSGSHIFGTEAGQHKQATSTFVNMLADYIQKGHLPQ